MGYASIAAQPALRFVNPRGRYPNLAATVNDGIRISLGVTPDRVDVDAQALRDLSDQYVAAGQGGSQFLEDRYPAGTDLKHLECY